MSIDRAVDRVLERLSDAQVEGLAQACEGRAAPGASLAAVVAGARPGAHAAVDKLADGWQSAPELTGAGVALALRAGLRARQGADTRRSRAVWTGPGVAGEQRLTAGVLHDLVVRASKRVLLVSFAAYTLPALATDLEAAVDRGCDVDVVFETEDDSAGAYSGPHSKPFGNVAGIRRWRWPADAREAGAVLHAKLLVVDGCRALIGSANLTKRALTANLEAGVLINDPDVAGGLEDHIRGLMAEGVLLCDSV